MRKLISLVLVVCFMALPLQVGSASEYISGLSGLLGSMLDDSDDEQSDDSEMVFDGPIVEVTVTEIVDFDDKIPALFKSIIDQYVERFDEYLDGEVDFVLEVHEDLKLLMDEYELFFDLYIEIVTDEDVDSIKALDFMTQFSEAVEVLGTMSEAELSEDDFLYYLVVYGRIIYKLATTEGAL